MMMNIEYIASLEKINDIMMIQQGQGFPNSEEIKNILKIKEIESMWPRLCIQFKGCSFSALPIMLHFLKKNDRYDKKIEFYISSSLKLIILAYTMEIVSQLTICILYSIFY